MKAKPHMTRSRRRARDPTRARWQAERRRVRDAMARLVRWIMHHYPDPQDQCPF